MTDTTGEHVMCVRVRGFSDREPATKYVPNERERYLLVFGSLDKLGSNLYGTI
jgi:hypothetical protein